MITIMSLFVLICLGAVVLFAIKTSCLFTRILAANSVGTLIVLFIILLGQGINTEFFVDIALIYALVNFVSVIGFLRYVQAQLIQGKNIAD